MFRRAALMSAILLGTSVTAFIDPVQPVSLEVRADEILGASPGHVLARLGVPAESTTASSAYAWHYQADGGKEIVIWFDDEAAIFVDSGAAKLVARRAPPETGAYIGQPVAEFLRRFGNAERISFGTATHTLEYADGMRVTTRGGRVQGISTR